MKNAFISFILIASYFIFSSVYARPNGDTTVKCDDIWSRGFPDARFKNHLCQDISLPHWNGKIKLYTIPSLGDQDSQYRAKVFISEALTEIDKKITELGGQKPKIWTAYVHDFSPADPDTHRSWAQATAHTGHAMNQEGCTLIIYKNIHSENDQAIKQVVAHEVFHCYQEYNFRDKFMIDPKSNDWWVEGTADAFAEYFYPHANYESDRDATYRPDKSIFEQNFFYANYMYFSSIIQEDGVKSLLSNLKHYTTDSESLQQQVASWGDNYNGASLFYNFAKKYTSHQLTDTGGRIINAPKAPHYPTIQIPKENFQKENLTVKPYTIYTQSLTFEKDGFYQLEFIKDQSDSGRDDDLNLAYRKKGDSEWTDYYIVPGVKLNIETSCKRDIEYEFLVTAAGKTLNPKNYHIKSTYEPSPCDCEDKLGFDQCLNGRWRLDHKTFNDYYEKQVIKRMNGMNPTYNGPNGNVFIEIDSSKKVKTLIDDFGVTVNFVTGSTENPMAVLVDVLMKGQIETHYGRPELGKMCLMNPTSNATYHTKVTLGDFEQENDFEMEPGQGQTLDYSCSQNYLLLKMRPKGTDMVIDLGFYRE